MSRNHPAVLDKAFGRAVARAKGIFSDTVVDNRLQGTAWIEALTQHNEQPIASLNQYCLEHQVNGICLTRFVIHLFSHTTWGICCPLNNGAPRRWKVVVGFW